MNNAEYLLYSEIEHLKDSCSEWIDNKKTDESLITEIRILLHNYQHRRHIEKKKEHHDGNKRNK